LHRIDTPKATEVTIGEGDQGEHQMKQPNGWLVRREYELQLRNERWSNHWNSASDLSGRNYGVLTSAINSVVLINGGTAAALLVFLGGTGDEPYFTVEAAIASVTCLAIGIFAGVVGYLFAYWAGVHRATSMTKLGRTDTWQYQAATSDSKKYQTLSDRFRNMTLLCFAVGAASYLVALSILLHDMTQAPSGQCGVAT